MMLGEIAPGGTGSGLYRLLIAVMIAVFIGGLMVGRTPSSCASGSGWARCATW